MGATFDRVRTLVMAGEWVASDHAVQNMADRAIFGSDLADSIATADEVENYPSYHLGPCALLLHDCPMGAVHALWGLAKGTTRPAVLITAYVPDPKQWMTDLRTRRT